MYLGLQQPLAPRRLDEACEPFCFRSARTQAERSDPEEARPSASTPGVCRRLDFGNELELDEAGKIPVQHRRPQPHPPAGALEHLGHDAKTVQLAIGEGEEYLEPMRFECRRIGRLRHVYLFRYIHRPKRFEPRQLSLLPAR